MTVESIAEIAERMAELLRARRIGGGRWQARCPAHPDKKPSLTITIGERCVLLRCWSAGCSVESIMAALQLPVASLFGDAQTTPAERAEAAKARTARDAEELHQRAVDRKERDRVFKLERLMDALGAKLLLRPGDEKLVALFHQVCDRLHDLEPITPGSFDGPLRLEAPHEVPKWIHDALVEISQDFQAEDTTDEDH